eukprot:1706491-Pyramimonas_sp.AAC.2
MFFQSRPLHDRKERLSRFALQARFLRIAASVSGREARRVGGGRTARARRSPGIGLNCKSGRQRRRSRPNTEGAETVGHGLLRVAVAWAMYASPVLCTEARVLAEDVDTLGRFENKCVQVAIAKMRRGRWRRDAFRSFERSCANHVGSGESMGDPDAKQNMLAAEAWLRCQQTYIWVYEAHSAAHIMHRTPLVRWSLGDADGRCVGAAVWFSEGHLVRVARGWRGMDGVEGVREDAPWLRVAAGGRDVAGPQSIAALQEVNASAGGEGQRTRVDAVMPVLPGLRNPQWYCFMNAPLQAFFALPAGRQALRTVPRGSPADWAGWHFAERHSAEQRSGRTPDFGRLLAQTMWEMECSGGSRPILLDAIPRVFYDRTQQDAGEFLQEVLNDERAPV